MIGQAEQRINRLYVAGFQIENQKDNIKLRI